eukprot:CAMPEP_0113489328 /NCGR_PEP_ID=MMETSP0014_2-20120614/26472_1 /TAXON_ID=2857 /ORGANISM="Nitzschia sp." /LENGTH=427 /DNA_ID=CAMNT_0000383061 /DNA_START=344 /DNA_END=1627 /DNA_ORIENTATION=+ /assembly_acc=CAM_ASM_000159
MAPKTSSSIRSVAVVGGTHGNEYTGVFCVKALQRVIEKAEKNNEGNKELFPFKIQALIGNPVAFQQNKRFVDTDLNRQFAYNALQTSSSLLKSSSPSQLSVEQKRAQELNELLGPKLFDDDDDQGDAKTDVIIDLHTTTASMGTVIIVGQGDVLTTQAAAYVMYKCSNNLDGEGSDDDALTDFTGGDHKEKKKPFNVSILMHTHPTQKERPHVASIGKHSFTIEVGAVPQGVLRHDKVEEMQRALKCALEFFKRHQIEQQQQQQENNGSVSSSPSLLEKELQQYYPDGKVPCYRSAPALKHGELSAKIGWPSDPSNDNFPAWLVHKDVQDKDFEEIKTGDPLFVDLDGNVIPYDGSHGSPIRVTFVNEGGYYYASSGTGIAVTQPDEFDMSTGQLLVEQDQEKGAEEGVPAPKKVKTSSSPSDEKEL